LNITLTCGQTPVEYNGGIETHIKEISYRLALKGANVKVLATSANCKRPYWTEIKGVRFETYPAIAPFETYFFSIPLYQALKSDNSEILHVHGYQTFSLLAAILTKKSGQKLFVTLHSGRPATGLTLILNRYYRAFLRSLLLKRADKIIGVSQVDLELLGFNQSCSSKIGHTAIVPNGVDISQFKITQEPPLSVSNNSRFILSVARLEKYKGHDFVISSFAKLKLMYSGNNDLKLVIVGSGKYKEHLIRLIDRLHLGNDVLILSKLTREELLGLYQKCTLFILLSQYESEGLSVIDAIAAGKPSLVSSTSALKEFVRKGYSIGIPYPPDNDTVAMKIQKVLENPSGFEPHNLKLNSWDFVVERLLGFYEESLKK
jgi:glycosyltransferase involved in cell wall biosynthesis